MTNQEIIEEIHHEFNMGRTKIFELLDNQVSKGFVHNELFERAEKKGIINTEISEYITTRNEFEVAQEKHNVICEYKVRYPAHRFITDEDVHSIVKKYGLVIGNKRKFIGDIPVSCLKQILNFELKTEDIGFKIPITNTMYKDSDNSNESNFSRSPKTYEVTVGYNFVPRDEFYTNPFNYIKYNSKNDYTLKGFFVSKYIKDKKHDVYEEVIRVFDDIAFRAKLEEYVTNVNEFIFVGTADQFKIEHNEVLIDGNITLEIKDDPICLKPVRYGYLILAMWGAESQLPEFQDVTNN